MLTHLTPRSTWRSWTAPTVDGNLAQRREAVLLNILGTFVVLGVVGQVIQWQAHLRGISTSSFWFWWPVLLVVTIGFYGLLQHARSGGHRTSAGALVGLLTAIGVLILCSDGFEHSTWSLLAALNVLLAALLLDRRTMLAVVAIHAVALVVVAALQSRDIFVPFDGAAAEKTATLGGSFGPALLLALIARSCWIYTREVLTSIDELLSHGAAESPLRQLRTKTLSVREIEVVQLVAEGLSNDGIAKRLFLSPRTVQSHVANAMGKSDCSNRTELGVLAIREGLVPLSVETETSPA